MCLGIRNSATGQLISASFLSSENNQVPDLVITSGMVDGSANKPYDSFQQYNHYSNLKTVESAWGLAPLTSNDGGDT